MITTITGQDVTAWNVADFTTFIPPAVVQRTSWNGPMGNEFKKLGSRQFYLDQEVNLDVQAHTVCGRALVCKCCNGEVVSVTVRKKHASGDSFPTYNSARQLGIETTWSLDESKADTLAICNFLDQTILAPRPTPTGVIVFFGETGSRKSTYARGLIDIYLKRLTNNNCSDRRPHLLTLEDPIEEFFGIKDRNVPISALPRLDQLRATAERLAVDYTPRCIGVDTESLNVGLFNALRQKPAVVYVGETRTHNDWRNVLDFGGTGHLVVTTSHAGSLMESITQLFIAGNTRSPAQRSFVAGRVLAVIHLRPYETKQGKLIVPAMWRRTPEGANNLVTDGIGSVLPNNPDASANTTESSLGRHWFGRFLSGNGFASYSEDFLSQLLLDDLQGL